MKKSAKVERKRKFEKVGCNLTDLANPTPKA
jgi:hypothetical protein